MSPARIARAAIVVSSLVGTWGCRGSRSEQPPVHLQQNMDFQLRGEAQERNDFWIDGRVMRPPVPGTVAVGHLHQDGHLWRGRLPSGELADVLPSSIELGPALLDRGRDRYDIYCSPCHGKTGHGNGPAAQSGGGFAIAPANFHQKKHAPAPLAYFFDVATRGKGSMKGYEAQIPVEDRWAIAVWVRTLQVSGRATADEARAHGVTTQPRRIP